MSPTPCKSWYIPRALELRLPMALVCTCSGLISETAKLWKESFWSLFQGDLNSRVVTKSDLTIYTCIYNNSLLPLHVY